MLSISAGVKRIAGREVVRDVSLSIERGEIVGLLGPNGAGKTTIFRLIAGLAHLDSGAVELDGADVTRLTFYERARRGLGYLPQGSFVFGDLSVEANFEMALELNVLRPADRRAAIDDLLNGFSAKGLRSRPVASLSVGERRRIEIALAVATRPSFVLLDEPFNGLDPLCIDELSGVARELARTGIGVLVTDHKARELFTLVDRAYVVSDGRVLAAGAPQALLKDSRVRQAYLGHEFTF